MMKKTKTYPVFCLGYQKRNAASGISETGPVKGSHHWELCTAIIPLMLRNTTETIDLKCTYTQVKLSCDTKMMGFYNQKLIAGGL